MRAGKMDVLNRKGKSTYRTRELVTSTKGIAKRPFSAWMALCCFEQLKCKEQYRPKQIKEETGIPTTR